LFSTTKTTGAFQMAAMFKASWNDPIFTAPSPQNETATRSSPCSFADIAAPTATGRPAPTIANAPIRPRE
jgi:hypothetical protein